MELIKTVLRVQFASATEPWLKIREMLRVAGGDPQRELHASPVVLDQPNKRQRVILQVRGVSVELEPLDSTDHLDADTLGLVTRMDKASEFPDVAQIEHTSMFIKQYSLPFHELLSLIKERWFHNNSLVEVATDVGLSLDEQEGENLRHMQMGPMKTEQLLSQYLIWPRENTPDVFLFALLSYTRNREEPFAQASLEELLRSAREWEEQQLGLMLQTLD